MGLVPVDLATAWSDRADDWALGAVVRFRDLLLTRQSSLVTVIACDSNAGIGERPADVLRQSARVTGYSAAKVPLMEVLAAGASPLVLINALGVALDGPGREILAGIQDCVRLSGHSPVITGSDETNVATVQTSVGVTVIGIAAADELLLGRARAGDDVLLVGRPMDGLRVPYDENDPEVVTCREVVTLAGSPVVREVLPVGSHGVRHEANELARTAGLRFEERAQSVDMTLSAGSSTCVVLACPRGALSAVADLVAQPITSLGRLVRGGGSSQRPGPASVAPSTHGR